jgi:hypothetical protein
LGSAKLFEVILGSAMSKRLKNTVLEYQKTYLITLVKTVLQVRVLTSILQVWFGNLRVVGCLKICWKYFCEMGSAHWELCAYHDLHKLFEKSDCRFKTCGAPEVYDCETIDQCFPKSGGSQDFLFWAARIKTVPWKLQLF